MIAAADARGAIAAPGFYGPAVDDHRARGFVFSTADAREVPRGGLNLYPCNDTAASDDVRTVTAGMDDQRIALADNDAVSDQSHTVENDQMDRPADRDAACDKRFEIYCIPAFIQCQRAAAVKCIRADGRDRLTRAVVIVVDIIDRGLAEHRRGQQGRQQREGDQHGKKLFQIHREALLAGWIEWEAYRKNERIGFILFDYNII